MMLLAVLAGALIGAAMQPIGVVCARCLLKSRDKSIEYSARENAFMYVALAIVGACIGLCAQSLPTACFLFAVLLLADVAASIDYHLRIIPNELVLMLFVIRLLFGIPALLGLEGFPAFDLASAALGCVVCTVVFVLPALFGKKVGGGDIKFVAAMGFCLGFYLSLYALALMGFLVLAYALYGRQLPFAERLKQMIPMGPYACVAMMAVLLIQMAPVSFF